MEKSVEDKEKLQTATGPAPTPANGEAYSPAQEAAPSPEKVKKRTVGNVVYDFGVFGSVAWGGVALLSALSAHEAMYGKNKAFGWLRTLNDKSNSGLTRLLSTTILKNAPRGETINGYAKGTTMFLTLGMGGNALMAFVKWLEDHRQSNAARIDHFLGTTPPDPETIAAEPKQTWKSVISGRLLSWGTSYAAFLAMGPKLTNTISRNCGEAVTNQWMKWKPHSNSVTVRRWADIAAFDVLFTIITAGLTYGFSRAIAKKDDKKIDFEDAVVKFNPAAPLPLESSLVATVSPFVGNEDVSMESQRVSHAQRIKPRRLPSKAPEASYAQRIAAEPDQNLIRN